MALPLERSQPDDATDADLTARASAGDAAALGRLYDRHAAPMLAIAYRLLQSRADAEDVVHDVFVGLPEALRRYDERGAFASWLRKITARVALARLRGMAGREEPLHDAHTAPQGASADDVISLETAVRALNPSLRAVLVLKEIEGFSHREIARMLDISVGASEVRLHRALRALRDALTKGEMP
jgi:RNA polymerase sigma-70 factor (ECF subfamily)